MTNQSAELLLTPQWGLDAPPQPKAESVQPPSVPASPLELQKAADQAGETTLAGLSSVTGIELSQLAAPEQDMPDRARRSRLSLWKRAPGTSHDEGQVLAVESTEAAIEVLPMF